MRLLWLCLTLLFLLTPLKAQFRHRPVPPQSIEGFLSGRVLTPEGAPVAGAQVQCIGRKRAGEAEGVALRAVQSDELGNYRLELARTASGEQLWGVMVHAPGWGLTLAPLYAAREGKLDIRLRPATALQLTFVDENGDFLRDVPVRLTGLAEQQGQEANAPYATIVLPAGKRWQARTDSNGRCTFPDLPQECVAYYETDEKYSLVDDQKERQARGEETSRAWLSTFKVTTPPPVILRELPPLRGTIEGRVINAVTRRPMAGAWVYALWDGPYAKAALCDNNGKYRITGLAAGTYSLKCQIDAKLTTEWAARRQEEIVLTEGQRLAKRTILVDRGAIIKGRILSDGAPQARCRVSTGGALTQYVSTSSAADGSFQLRVGANKYFLYVSLPADAAPVAEQKTVITGTAGKLVPLYGSEAIEVGQGETVELEYRMTTALPKPPEPPKPLVWVRVLGPGGLPVAGATVVPGLASRLWPSLGRDRKWPLTDYWGRVVLPPDLPNLPWPTRDGYVRAFKSTATITDPESMWATAEAVRLEGASITLHLKANILASVRGRVLLASGERASQGEVMLFSHGADRAYLAGAARLGADGSYTFPNLWPDLPYSVYVQVPRQMPARTEIFKVSSGSNEAPALYLNRAHAFVAGRVVNLKNQPVEGAEVTCSGDNTAAQRLTTGADGRFRFEGVMPEKIYITVRKKYPPLPERTFESASLGESIELRRSVQASSDDVLFKLRHF